MNLTIKDILTNYYKEQMIAFMHQYPHLFDEAVLTSFSDNQPYATKAAWLLWSCMEYDDERVKKYLYKYIENIENKPDSHQRELLKVLYNLDLDEENEVFIYDFCVKIWIAIGKKPSVRYNALKMLLKIAQTHIDLFSEIELLTHERYLESLSGGVRHSVRKMISEFKKRNSL